MIYQWHMPSAGPVVCRLYTTVIHCNTSVPGVWCGWMWAMDRHLATPMPINVGDLPVLWCAGCIILSYTPMPAGCMPSAGPMVCQLYNTIIHSCTTRESYTRPGLECMTV